MFDLDFNDVTFWGMNIPKEIKDIMDRIEEDATNKMTDTEKQIYKLAVDNTLGLMKQILDESVDEESVVFYNTDTEITTEFTADGLLKWINSKK